MKPPSFRAPIPDYEPPSKPWHGSVGEQLAAKDREIARLRSALAAKDAVIAERDERYRRLRGVCESVRFPAAMLIAELEKTP